MSEQSETIDDPLCAAANRHFGISYLFPYQRLVIANTLEAAAGEQDAARRHVVLLPTGAGKSLCFQLPAALLGGCTVVIYPLLSLIADQARRMQSSGISFAVLTGRTDQNERRTILQAIRRGNTRVLLTNPETLCTQSVIATLSGCRVDHLVMDEAHCVCEWGETFRPAYIEVGAAVKSIAPRVITAFTATASNYVLASIQRHLFFDQPVHLVSANPDRPNIRYYVIPAVAGVGALRDLLGPPRSGPSMLGYPPPLLPVPRPAIVFSRSRAGAQITAARLRRSLNDDRINFYHAGLSPQEKKRIEEWFFDSADGVLIATCAYGMGVDKKEIRTVIHPEPAPSVESFLQESGRAGRDGEPALSISLAPCLAPGQTGLRSTAAVAIGEEAEETSLETLRRRRSQAMQRYLLTGGCRRAFLIGAMGSDPVECSGCDYCDHLYHPDSSAMTIVHSAARRNRRTLSPGALARVLCARLNGSDREKGLQANRDLGVLAGWNRAEIDELISAAIASGGITVHQRGPWKGAIDAPRKLS